MQECIKIMRFLNFLLGNPDFRFLIFRLHSLRAVVVDSYQCSCGEDIPALGYLHQFPDDIFDLYERPFIGDAALGKGRDFFNLDFCGLGIFWRMSGKDGKCSQETKEHQE